MEQLTKHKELENVLFNIDEFHFESFALKIFNFQYSHNTIYRQYCEFINVRKESVKQLFQIPFLPIQFFKSQQVTSTIFRPDIIFESSGTTGSVNSKHIVKDSGLYRQSFLHTFKQFYGDPEQYCIIGLLPSYLERQNSSLVWMLNELINMSKHAESGFYLYDHDQLKKVLEQNEIEGVQTILFGVTYALLDFFEKYPLKLQNTIIIETGGMKGRREELTRNEIHRRLTLMTGIKGIHSEYGMTELLSQAYAKEDGIFQCPPWMSVLIRSEDDPFEIQTAQMIGAVSKSAVINVIDLANIYSCSFIATEDLGKLYKNGSFEVLGRLDLSDIRGCSLLLQ